jgi:hypothetical protein
MWPASALVVALAAAVLLGLAVARVRVTRQAAEEAERDLVRLAARYDEAARAASLRAPIADAVELGSGLARLGHGTVAGVSFRLLDAVSGGRTRGLRRRHDALADAVYGAIEAAADAVRGTDQETSQEPTRTSPDS